ncbi:hypothetical protein GQ457_16G026390 [Hibiscus cannabinus]
MDFFTSSLLCLLLTWFLLQAFKSFRNGSKSSESKLPPGPRRLPIFGNLFDLGDKPHRSLTKLAQVHGPFMSLKLGSLFTVVVSSEAMAKEVLQRQDLTFSNRTVVDATRACQHHEVSLSWMPVSPLWRTLRKLCNTHLFAAPKLDSSEHLRRDKIQQLIASVGNCCLKDLVGPNSSDAQEFKETVWNLMAEGGKPNLADYFPLFQKIDPQGIRSRAAFHLEKLLNLFEKMYDERRGSRKSQVSNDVLDTLLDIIEGGSEELNKTHALHLLSVLYIAGTDTTSATLEWAMAELLRNQHVLHKAKKELDQAIGKGNPIEESDISRLPYLQAIVKETFRMHPVVPLLLPRRAGSDAELGGFRIPEGSQVLVNVWAIGRDPSIWDNPNSFIPERFLESEVNVKGRHFGLIPFGGGRRVCPGLPLAIRMLHLMLGSLVNCFDWELEDEIDMEEKFGITVQMAKPLRAIPILV